MDGSGGGGGGKFEPVHGPKQRSTKNLPHIEAWIIGNQCPRSHQDVVMESSQCMSHMKGGRGREG